MKKTDHLALAAKLINALGCTSRRNGLAFMLGSVEPDINVFSYLRGWRCGRRMHGHDAGNCAKHLSTLILRLQQRRIDSFWSWFLLGTLMHYLADSFTAVHNSFMAVPVAEHLEYENRLHTALMAQLEKDLPLTPLPYSPICLMKRCHDEYSRMEHCTEVDARTIVSICSTVFLALTADEEALGRALFVAV
ncbi:MAG: zinc dependent phospholipase C family protein [Spirochaetes bacterium]|uniref:Zinc dependent phospholipase C family protein n=1 Tax=Candidatus Aphodenecus pullistercoris TaxID=2840669 RepID=A0A9D9EC86_9SPIR|nr:zinc dependent phospholipase C family protein [Candidatus Aphodenecus pullistercoris]